MRLALPVDRDGLGDPDGLDLARLSSEPSPGAQVVRESLLQRGAPAGAQERLPRAGGGQLGDPALRRSRPGGLGPAHPFQRKPEDVVRPQRQRVGSAGDRGELVAPEELDGHEPGEGGEVELRVFGEPREVGDDQDRLGAVAADIGQDLAVVGIEKGERAVAEGVEPLAQGDDPLGPPERRARVVLLDFDVDRLEVVLRIRHDRQVEPLRGSAGEAGVAVAAPLHGRAHAVAVAQVDVVPHPDLVAVVEDRRPRQREQERHHQLDLAPVVAQQRREPPADPDVDAHLPVLGVDAVHVVALLVGDHLERQLVVVAEKERPLGRRGDRRRLRQDVHDGEPILHPERHEHPGHQGKVERHVAFVSFAEIRGRVLGPLVGLGEEHPVGEVPLDVAAQRLQKGVGLREVLAARAFPLVEVRDRVEAHSVHAEAEPEVEGPEELPPDLGALEIQIGLMRIEAVPVIGLGDRIPGPVGGLEVLEDDPAVAVLLQRVAPDVEVPGGGAGLRPPGALEPGVLVRGVVQDELGDHAQPPAVRLAEQGLEVRERAVGRVHARVVGDVVAVVPEGRGIEGEEPDGGDAEVPQVVEFLRQPAEIADPVGVAVAEGPDVGLVEDGILVPERLVAERDLVSGLAHSPSCFPGHRK